MDAMSIAGVAMQDDLNRVNSISRNLANVLTIGYKREIPVSRSFADYMGAANGLEAAAAIDTSTTIDQSAGTLRATSHPLDLAIDGAGFFEVMTETGPAFTRQGMLRADARGRLVAQQGLPVMGQGGEMTVTNGPIAIAPNGEVRQDDRVIGQIKLVRFANPDALIPLGNGLFKQGAARIADTDNNGVVRSGYQENSNVNSALEMTRLSETVRHFEAMQKVVQGYDDVLEKAIRKLGDL